MPISGEWRKRAKDTRGAYLFGEPPVSEALGIAGGTAAIDADGTFLPLSYRRDKELLDYVLDHIKVSQVTLYPCRCKSTPS
jgi:hypothetical protein